MTRATLEPPPAQARTPEATGAAPHVPVRAPFTRAPRHERGGQISRRGVALSLGAHLLLALVVWVAPVRRPVQPGDAPQVGAPSDAVSYVDIGAWPGDEGGAGGEPAPAAPQTATTGEQVAAPVQADTASVAAPELRSFPQRAPTGIPARAAPRAGGAPAGAVPGTGVGPGTGAPGAGTGTGGRGRSGAAGGRLGTELGDGRLVVRPEAARETPMSDNDRVRARIARSLGAYNDSVADEARRRHRAENWTIKDRQGREWGIGKCGAPVIAGRRIPTCTTPPVGRSRESELHDAETRRQRGEIDRQEDTQDLDRNMRERTRATRERMDREREQRRRERAPGNP
ncbi:MAG TPA: hypothetical protein VF584_26405 [Longimicrobium sp.]|jgi:hypothetical protein